MACNRPRRPGPIAGVSRVFLKLSILIISVAVCILRGKLDPGPAPRTGEGGRRLRWRCALSVRSGTMGALMKAGVLWTATARPLGCAAVDAATAVVSEEGRLRHR